MHNEYAVEPRAIASSWEKCLYLSEKFGFDKGRVLSLYPEDWLNMALRSVDVDMPPMKRKRILTKLRALTRNCSIASERNSYDYMRDWIENALKQQNDNPFHAIIAASNPSKSNTVLCVDDVHEEHNLMKCPRSRVIPREVDSITETLQGMLRFSSRILFVDPFFDPYKQGYKDIFRSLLAIVKEYSLADKCECEIHYRFHKNNFSAEKSAKMIAGILPKDMHLKLYRWKEIEGGEDFHARYLLTDKGGIKIDAGFDPVGDHETTDVDLMDYDHYKKRWAQFDRDAGRFELIGPVLRISADGEMQHV